MSGSKRPYRILQKRGQIIDAEDFLPVRETYPSHPMTNIQPKAKDLNDVQERRKREIKGEIDMYKKAWEKANPPAIDMPFI